MRELLDDVYRWYRAGETFALATVVSTFRSAPRPPGAAMAVSRTGQAVGSVSGGCVEAAVYEAAQEARDTGQPQLETYGVSDDDAFAVGLTCGGILDVYIEPISRDTFPELPDVVRSVRSGQPVAVATVVSDGRDAAMALGTRLVVWPDRVAGTLGCGPSLDATIAEDVRALMNQGGTTVRHYDADGRREGGELTVFAQSFRPAPRMLVFGAVDFAAAVAGIGAFLGYRVTVCDARPTFATPARFPRADEVIVRWPHEYLAQEAAQGRIDERTVLAVLTHDPKFDVPLLTSALKLPAFSYIGALGSRQTHLDRLARLREAGLTEDELSRLHSPVGLDLGGRTPEETAVSIAAEIIAATYGGSGMPLRGMTGPVHTASPVHAVPVRTVPGLAPAPGGLATACG